jgi:hypothetical protein
MYEEHLWGDNGEKEYNGTSGDGSDVKYNIDTYIPFIKDFIKKNNIHKIIDLGCGDFRCGPYIYNDINVNYIGYDTYLKVINKNIIEHGKYRFKHLDFFANKEDIESGDLCIIKDVLQHWKLLDIYKFLDYLALSKKFKYIIICNCCHQIRDGADIINMGDFRGLSAKYYPLKRYDAEIIFNYNTKEVSLIKC